MLLFRRKEMPWEVVDTRSVDPVPMYYEDEGERETSMNSISALISSFVDLDLVSVKENNVRRTYVLEVKRDARQHNDLHNAVVFAREQLFKEVKKNGYNTLLLER